MAVNKVGSPFYRADIADNFSGSFVDFSLDGGDPTNQYFLAGGQAFTGVMTLDMSGLSSTLLPVTGKVGNIYAGYSASASHVLLGQYTVVPEAGLDVLLLAGGFGLAAGCWLRRRRAA